MKSSEPKRDVGTRTILWAVDPFQEPGAIWSNTLSTLRLLSKQPNTWIRPVYAFPAEYATGSEFYYLRHTDLSREATRALERVGMELGVKNLLPAVVLDKPSFTTSGSARVLIDYAIDVEADLIVVGTHGRKGLPRLFLGSFAESLVLQSPIPILTITANVIPVNKIEHIVFASDLGEESRKVFDRVIEFARNMGARLTVLHAIYRPVAVLPPTEGASTLAGEYMEDFRIRAHERGEALLAKAQGAGVEAKLVILESEGMLSDTIANFCDRREVQLIAMAAQSSRLASVVTGSLTRQIIRMASRPVWVLRSELAAKEQKRAA